MKRAVGIEIEAICNANEIPLSRGGYHDGITISGAPLWRTESDSSIGHRYGDTDGFGSWGACCEFVTKTLRLKSSYDIAIKQFKDVFSKGGTLELHKVLCFNSSCGTHITMSGNFLAVKILPWSILKRLREKFYKEIKESNIGSKKDILAHYYREFSRKSDVMFRKQVNKSYEFNATKEHRGRGLEWRGVNMLGIKTWAEYDEFFKIIWRCVDYFAHSLNEYQVSERIVPSHYKEEKEVETLRVEPSREQTEKILIITGNRNETTMHTESTKVCPRCSSGSAGNCICSSCGDCGEIVFNCTCTRCAECGYLENDCNCDTCNECGENGSNCSCEDGGNW